MGKSLVIAEKPSVAGDIARALGGFKKEKDYFESDELVVSSAVGHLLQIKEPAEYEVKRGKWTFSHLPVIPDHFDLNPIEKSESRLKLLVKLIKRKDIDTIINACDAGREGELIFQYILRHSKSQKPTRRLWLQSMTQGAIREGFAALWDGDRMRPLANAATCRSESDWLVGINGTRAMTAFNSKAGGFYLTTVGRVQTPTLAIVVDRENKIKKFVSRDYQELHATFGCEAGEYIGRWFDETFSRVKDGDPELKAERLWDKVRAEAIREKCLGKPGHVTEESKPSTSMSPLLFDLTSLQREANGRYGFSASMTLKIAQTLYERHKVLTYPRTDSRALPEDYLDTVRETLEVMRGGVYQPAAKAVLENGWVKPNKRIFNNAKISDHFAIIPTTQAPKSLNDAEEKIYDMVVKRFLAIFHPPAEFLVTTRITRVESEAFKTEGKVMVKPGWLAVYGKDAPGADDASTLAPVKEGEQVDTREIELKELQTRPPARYSEATLLSAMEGAGKLVDDEELREAMSEKGLGTPATRASIIEGLIYEKYLLRTGRELQPTAKGISLIRLLTGLGIKELCSPELTGDWEYKLKQIEQDKLAREDFMQEIAAMTRRIVETARSYENDTVPGDFGELSIPCPKCGSVIKENYKAFKCSKCEFQIFKIVAGREFEIPEVEQLIVDKHVGPLEGFRSKMGRPFTAMIKLSDENKVEFDFGNDDRNGNSDEAVDFTGREPLGPCPKCNANVFENGMNYVCEKAVGPDKSCDFRSGKVILQQTIEPAQMSKLLGEGKTDLLDKFISKRNGRAFKAHLVMDKDKGKIGFEFEKREPRAKKGGKASAPAEKLDFTGQESLGKCPRCGGRVFRSETDYICENSQRDTKPCKFKSGKVILEQPIDEEQMRKLLTAGRTDPLDKFVSRYGKAFAATLVMNEKGKVEFEFAEKAE